MNSLKISHHDDVVLFQLGSNLLGKPQMYVYSYWADGLLIDTGQRRVQKEFLKLLDAYQIDKILLTHSHEDHSGNVEAIKRLKSIDAYGSPKCVELMQSPPRIEPARYITWGQNTPADISPLDLTASIETSNYKFEIIETPGHAIDQINFYERNQGWLFSGDLFVNDYIKAFMREEVISDQIKSIQRVLQLDFDVLFCNHQPVLSGGKSRLQSKLQFLQDFYGKVVIEYQKGLNPKQIMQSLGINEMWAMKLLSLGQLSRLNMVKSVIQSYEASK